MTYAQHKEDLIAACFFSDEATARGELYAPLRFCEVGAGDGRLYSNTLLLEQQGWEGILIEPHPLSAAAARQVRKARVVQCACVADNTTHGVTLHMAALAELSTIVADAEPFVQMLHERVGVKHSFQPQYVRAATLSSILCQQGIHTVRHAPPFGGLDFLSVDAEWYNVPVLEGMDFQMWRPRLVVVEANDKAEEAGVKTVMRRAGYTFALHHVNNLFFTRDAADATYLAYCAVRIGT